MKRLLSVALAMLSCLPAPARAEVQEKADNGFVTVATVDIPGKAPAEVWPVLLAPARWWNPDQAWSGDASGMAIDGQAGGCFCEMLPLPPDVAPGTRQGSVEHARVLAAMPPRLLRLSGALGPLQGEALAGTLTVVLKELAGGGTHMTWTYVVGGFMRMKVEDIAPVVDRVLTQQAGRLADAVNAPAPPPPPDRGDTR